MNNWYSQYNLYDYSNPKMSNFAQVVWKSSTKLGCGLSLGKDVLAVCFYSPEGNVNGQFAQNVMKFGY